MNIAIIGLGLIGGSLAKAISSKTEHICYGIDTDKRAVIKATEDRSVVSGISADKLSEMDVVFVCLHPDDTVKFIKENADKFRKGGIVADTCGIKSPIVSQAESVLIEKGVHFIGCHPMAGREFSGYDYSKAEIFVGASFIVTPTENTDKASMETIKNIVSRIGFSRFIITDMNMHDRTIAYTSQLAHIASNAYVKSPSLMLESGFTGGSFQDLTRVARLNENMWTELFLENRENLIGELDNYIDNLKKYSEALKNSDSKKLKKLLKEGRELKESVND